MPELWEVLVQERSTNGTQGGAFGTDRPRWEPAAPQFGTTGTPGYRLDESGQYVPDDATLAAQRRAQNNASMDAAYRASPAGFLEDIKTGFDEAVPMNAAQWGMMRAGQKLQNAPLPLGIGEDMGKFIEMGATGRATRGQFASGLLDAVNFVPLAWGVQGTGKALAAGAKNVSRQLPKGAKVRGEHLSPKAGLDHISPDMPGTNPRLRGAESSRPQVSGSYWNDAGIQATPEAGLGPHGYRADLSRVLMPGTAAQNKIRAEATRNVRRQAEQEAKRTGGKPIINKDAVAYEFERLVDEKGYYGYAADTPAGRVVKYFNTAEPDQLTQRVVNRPTADNIARHIRDNPEGGSIYPNTGTAPASGIAVAQRGAEQVVEGTPSAGTLTAYMGAQAARGPGADDMIGWWGNQGNTYLDRSRIASSPLGGRLAGEMNYQKAVYDVGKGEEIPMTLRPAMEAAGRNLSMPGPVPGSRAAQRGSWGTGRSMTADHDMLKIAQEADAKGMPMDRIRDATGWEKGVDDIWRYEIDDSQAALTNLKPAFSDEAAGREFPVRVGTLSQQMSHDKLYAAWPTMANVSTRMQTGHPSTTGAYYPQVGRSPSMIVQQGDGGQDSLLNLLHEAGHGVQQRARTASGGSPETMPWLGSTPGDIDIASIAPLMEKYNIPGDDLGVSGSEFLARVRYEMKAAGAAPEELGVVNRQLAQMMQRDQNLLSDQERYMRLAGETEARNISARQALTADDRRMLPARLTEDRPRDVQTVWQRNDPAYALPGAANKDELFDLWEKYDNTGELLIDDVVDELDFLIADGRAPDELQDAVDFYRELQAENWELAGRGDMGPAEKMIEEGIKRHMKAPAVVPLAERMPKQRGAVGDLKARAPVAPAPAAAAEADLFGRAGNTPNSRSMRSIMSDGGEPSAIDASRTVYKGKPVTEWTPKDFEGFGAQHGVTNLGPLTPYKKVAGFDIPGGTEGKFTYYDLMDMKSRGIDPNSLPPAVHAELQQKLSRTMTPEANNPVQVFNRYLFGLLSPNQPLTPNEFEAIRLFTRSPADIKRLGKFIDWNPGEKVSAARRKAAELEMVKFFNTNSAGTGGLGLKGTADYTNIAELAKMFEKNPEWFTRRSSESWENFLDRVQSQVRGATSKVGSFATVWQEPGTAGISAIDRHMIQKFREEAFTPAAKINWEKGRVPLWNKAVEKRRVLDKDLKAGRVTKAEHQKAVKMLPGSGSKKVRKYSDIKGQPNATAWDDSQLMSYITRAKTGLLRTKAGEVNQKLPEHLRTEAWVAEPEKVVMIGDQYRAALGANRAEAAKHDLGLFESQWMLWDRIRNRLEPHEVMFPGLEKLPPMHQDELKAALKTHSNAGYLSTGRVEGKGQRHVRPMPPAGAAYWGAAGAGVLANEYEKGLTPRKRYE